MSRELLEDEYRILMKIIFRLSAGRDDFFEGEKVIDCGFDLKVTTMPSMAGTRYWLFQAPTWTANIHLTDLVEFSDADQFDRDLVAIRLATS
jgi:hypothetical protein